jgi:hypothetical protein
MKQTYSVQEVETAINQWRNLEQTGHAGNVILGPRVRELADIYGAMIFMKSNFVNTSELTPSQLDALSI